MKAFLTGSRVYGRPGDESDVDLVVLMTEAELNVLRQFADDGGEEDPYGTNVDRETTKTTTSLRFGNLNLLVCTEEVPFAVWRECTEAAKKKVFILGRGIRRETAVELFTKFRKLRGLGAEEPK